MAMGDSILKRMKQGENEWISCSGYVCVLAHNNLMWHMVHAYHCVSSLPNQSMPLWATKQKSALTFTKSNFQKSEMKSISFFLQTYSVHYNHILLCQLIWTICMITHTSYNSVHRVLQYSPTYTKIYFGSTYTTQYIASCSMILHTQTIIFTQHTNLFTACPLISSYIHINLFLLSLSQ